MTKNQQFVQDALVTESTDYEAILSRLNQAGMVRLLHASIGFNTEQGEFQDMLKKHLFYGKPLDKVNLMEEIGDSFWYAAIACDELGISFDEVMDKVIAKLKARYAAKFSERAALNRNLAVEREVLEKQD